MRIDFSYKKHANRFMKPMALGMPPLTEFVYCIEKKKALILEYFYKMLT